MGEPGRERVAGWREPGRGLLHPVALAAVVVLVVNDHALKAWFPDPMTTGKLSDFAGLVFFPLFLEALAEVVAAARGRPVRPALGRTLAAIAATGVVFALVKTWVPAHAAYELGLAALQWPFRAAFGLASGAGLPPLGRAALMRDATDLIALVALVVPYVLGRRRAS